MHRRRWTITLIAALAFLAGLTAALMVVSHNPAAVKAQAPGAQLAAVGTGFTYQGQLTDSQGDPLTGTYDFEFELYDDSGSGANQVGSTVTVNDEQVSDGLFTVQLDFGSDVFTGDARWLEIHVRAGDTTGGYTQLLPRQPLTPTPYALGLRPGAAITGTLNNAGVLALGNPTDDGLRIHEAGGDGVQVTSAGYGIYVKSATVDGVLVDSAGNDGVHIQSASSDGVFVGSANYGLSVSSARTDGIFVSNADSDNNGVGVAGYFDGDVRVTDHLTATNLHAVSSKSFVIDHPLDPENQYLYHSSVESPDRMNVYNGNVTLDDNGEAWVQLPDYFEALNRDFRYQLTPIGGPGPDLYIAEEIRDNRFRIAGGEAGLKVSWQVTGIRDDAAARANPMEVEVDKPANQRGRYLSPDAHGESPSMAIGAAERAEKGSSHD